MLMELKSSCIFHQQIKLQPKIIKFIDNVDYTMEFGLLSFTKNDIGDAVVNKELEFGVNIRGIMEQENINGSEFDNLINNGVNVKSHTGVTHQFHHKYLHRCKYYE